MGEFGMSLAISPYERKWGTSLYHNQYQELFDRQKRTFASGVTRPYDWRVDQLDRMAKMLAENEDKFQAAIREDFKTATQEYIFETFTCIGEVSYQKSQLREWMTPVEVSVPKALAVSGHRGVIYRDPHGVALIVGPFNGPLVLLLRPAMAALAAGNCCVFPRAAGTDSKILRRRCRSRSDWWEGRDDRNTKVAF